MNNFNWSGRLGYWLIISVCIILGVIVEADNRDLRYRNMYIQTSLAHSRGENWNLKIICQSLMDTLKRFSLEMSEEAKEAMRAI
jgi:hypothetical protein